VTTGILRVASPSATAGLASAFRHAASEACPRKPRGVTLGVVLAMVCCLLYVTVGGIIVTRAIAGSSALDDPHTRADQSEAITPAPQSGGLSGAPDVVAITVEDSACEHTCVGTFTVHCTTTQASVSAAWILVAPGEFETLYRELGCAAVPVDPSVTRTERETLLLRSRGL
jgi:hypothetical protein